jgi:hypothetical protein
MFGSNWHFRSLEQDYQTKSDRSEGSTSFGSKMHFLREGDQATLDSSLDLLQVVEEVAQAGVA